MSYSNDKESDTQKSDGVKQSFAWGQLFAGTLIGGLAVWKLLHKLTNTEPSEWFVGLATAYEEWRDFLMTPFEWIPLELHMIERDMLVYELVLSGALLRTAIRYRRFGAIASLLMMAGIVPVLLIAWSFGEAISAKLVVNTLFYALSIISFFGAKVDEGGGEDAAIFMNSCVLVTALWGTILLLLNWATS
jgi:hypothetical protein